MFGNLKAQNLPTDDDMGEQNMSLEDLEARQEDLFDKIREDNTVKEVDLFSAMESLHYERSTLQFIKNQFQKHNSVPQDVINLMYHQDPDTLEVFPNLFSTLENHTPSNITGATAEIDAALEAINKTTQKTVNTSVKSAERGVKTNLKAAASLAAVVAAIGGFVYLVRKIVSFKNQNKVPTYDEMSQVLDALSSTNEDIISFARDVIDKKLYENKNSVQTRANQFFKKYGDTLNMSFDNTGRKVVYGEIYNTVQKTTLEEAGYDGKALTEISEKIKTITLKINKKSSELYAVLSEINSHSERVARDLNLTNAEAAVIHENLFMASNFIDILMHQTHTALEEAETYVKRIEDMIKKDEKESS